jgi:hypothetical protein
LQELIDTKGAWPSKNKWDVNKAVAVLDARTQRREQVFTGAYIITNGGIAEPKTHVVMERYLQPLWEVRAMLGPQMRSSSIQAAHRALVQYLGWGGFMAYEVMCDLRYTAFLNRAIDKSTWAHAGPGALRGLGRLNGKLPAPREAVVQMQNLLNLISPLWYLAFPKDPLLEMREIEHSLCEFDKYERVRNGEGRPRSKYSPQDEGRLP